MVISGQLVCFSFSNKKAAQHECIEVHSQCMNWFSYFENYKREFWDKQNEKFFHFYSEQP